MTPTATVDAVAPPMMLRVATATRHRCELTAAALRVVIAAPVLRLKMNAAPVLQPDARTGRHARDPRCVPNAVALRTVRAAPVLRAGVVVAAPVLRLGAPPCRHHRLRRDSRCR